MISPTAPTDDEELAHLVALACLPEVGPSTLAACRLAPGARETWEAVRAGRAATVPALVDLARSRGRAIDAVRWAAEASAVDPPTLLAAHRRDGQLVLAHGDAAFPDRLAEDPVPPPLLFARGDPGALHGPAVAIVGTRNATRLGRETAASLAADLAARGVSVVSGLALGIDGAAHRALVDLHGAGAPPGTGRPVGVVAAGLDRPYPRRHLALHAQVAEVGVVLGETPMGGAPLRWRFPARNRIIAALADAVVVVESRSAGGSMLTAAEALTRGIPVLAVPAHPRSPAGAGALDLIAEGAAPVRDVDDVLVAIGAGGSRRLDEHGDPLGPEVAERLEQGPATLHELVEWTGRELGAVAASLTALELAGSVVRQGPWYELTGRSGADAADERCR